jgi:DNA-directed RNA polymerase specialized sigma subunit
MATATAVKTTRSGRPKVPALNKARILAAAADRLDAELAAIPDPKARLRHLSEVEAAAHHVIEENETAMRKQALSVALHEGARGVYQAIGLSREAFSRMTADALGDWPERPVAWDETVIAKANERKVRFYRDAAKTLPDLALKVVTAKAQKDVIRPRRDALVKELFEVQGLKRTEIAEIIGRTPSRVSHITKAG